MMFMKKYTTGQREKHFYDGTVRDILVGQELALVEYESGRTTLCKASEYVRWYNDDSLWKNHSLDRWLQLTGISYQSERLDWEAGKVYVKIGDEQVVCSVEQYREWMYSRLITLQEFLELYEIEMAMEQKYEEPVHGFEIVRKEFYRPYSENLVRIISEDECYVLRARDFFAWEDHYWHLHTLLEYITELEQKQLEFSVRNNPNALQIVSIDWDNKFGLGEATFEENIQMTLSRSEYWEWLWCSSSWHGLLDWLIEKDYKKQRQTASPTSAYHSKKKKRWSITPVEVEYSPGEKKFYMGHITLSVDIRKPADGEVFLFPDVGNYWIPLRALGSIADDFPVVGNILYYSWEDAGQEFIDQKRRGRRKKKK